MKEEESHCLIIILDISPISWALNKDSKFKLPSILNSLLIFINAHLSLSHSNTVEVIASNNETAKWIHQSSNFEAESQIDDFLNDSDDLNQKLFRNMYQPFAATNANIYNGIKQITEEFELPLTKDNDQKGRAHTEENKQEITRKYYQSESQFAMALSLALCFYNRKLKNNSAINFERIKGQILLVSISKDASSQYVPLMNGIFSAQKLVKKKTQKNPNSPIFRN